jgi:hypothetical protein
VIEKKVSALLLADTTVKTLVGTRIYPVVVRKDDVLPCITYMRQSGDRDYVLSGRAGWARVNIGLLVWAMEYNDARVIAEAVRVCLDTYGDTTSGGIRIANVTDGPDGYDEIGEVFSCALNVIVQWEES